MTDKPTEGAAAHVGVEEQIARLQAMVDSSAEWAERSGLEDHGYNKLQRSILATLRSNAATAASLAASQAALGRMKDVTPELREALDTAIYALICVARDGSYRPVSDNGMTERVRLLREHVAALDEGRQDG